MNSVVENILKRNSFKVNMNVSESFPVAARDSL